MNALKALLARWFTRIPRRNPGQNQSGRNTTAVAISQHSESADSTHKKPESPNTVLQSNHLRTLKSGLILLLSKVEPMLEGSPFQIPFNVVNTVIDLATAVSENDDHFLALFDQVSHHVDIVNTVLPETLSAKAKTRLRVFSEFVS
ncbi:hypothetical protein R3P38DRAFT_3483041 [Favolaschia claudopus]|uniref:Uncharacterized protein n=1 Tax=Favolaschia claudopus TaxID=2862362 RepID=A0AAV9Z6T8_9AGAR